MAEFTVSARIVDGWIDFNIDADTLEQALTKGREKLKSVKFIDTKNVNWIDGHLEIFGING